MGSQLLICKFDKKIFHLIENLLPTSTKLLFDQIYSF